MGGGAGQFQAHGFKLCDLTLDPPQRFRLLFVRQINLPDVRAAEHQRRSGCRQVGLQGCICGDAVAHRGPP